MILYIVFVCSLIGTNQLPGPMQILSIRPIGTHFSAVFIVIQTLSLKIELKLSSAKCEPFHSGLNMLKVMTASWFIDGLVLTHWIYVFLALTHQYIYIYMYIYIFPGKPVCIIVKTDNTTLLNWLMLYRKKRVKYWFNRIRRIQDVCIAQE